MTAVSAVDFSVVFVVEEDASVERSVVEEEVNVDAEQDELLSLATFSTGVVKHV